MVDAGTIRMKRAMLRLRFFTVEDVARAADVSSSRVREFLRSRPNLVCKGREPTTQSVPRGRPRLVRELTKEGAQELTEELRMLESVAVTVRKSEVDGSRAEVERQRYWIGESVASLEVAEVELATTAERAINSRGKDNDALAEFERLAQLIASQLTITHSAAAFAIQGAHQSARPVGLDFEDRLRELSKRLENLIHKVKQGVAKFDFGEPQLEDNGNVVEVSIPVEGYSLSDIGYRVIGATINIIGRHVDLIKTSEDHQRYRYVARQSKPSNLVLNLPFEPDTSKVVASMTNGNFRLMVPRSVGGVNQMRS